MTLSSFPLELGEGDVQVPVAKLRQSPALHCGHQATRESPASGVGVEPRACLPRGSIQASSSTLLIPGDPQPRTLPRK